jgi:ubiquinone/menaquinone biosynthesis C-methylase UbiE
MTTDEQNDGPSYAAGGETQGVRLERIWGDGFMSPGGPEEISRIVGKNRIYGLEVLDIGCGVGGADIVLLQEHSADSVIGIDVEDQLVEWARARARRLGLQDRLQYERVEPGPLPFDDASFDVVFSKDAIIHIQDKIALYAEAFRVLRPGGLLLVGDWLGAEGMDLSPKMERWIEQSGHDFSMASLNKIGEIVQSLGFVGIELEDRQAWYVQEARQELARIRGPLKSELVEAWGEEDARNYADSWELLVEVVAEGSLRPGHVRGMKPKQ